MNDSRSPAQTKYSHDSNISVKRHDDITTISATDDSRGTGSHAQ